jgi:predicted kinase
MEAVILVGLQASGKSTFFRERFFDSHVRINGDMLKTRHRETLLLQACLDGKQPFVIDKTNVTREARSTYVAAARARGFRVIGYYFQSNIQDCMKRNADRPASQVIPEAGLLGTYGRLELPDAEEGFDALQYVSIDDRGAFQVEEWSDEVR